MQTDALKSATPESADIREGVGYSGMQRGFENTRLSPLNDPLGCRLTRARALNHEETHFAWPVSSSKWFVSVVMNLRSP